MPPIWFLIFVAVCATFAVRATIRGFRGGGIYAFGERQSSVLVVLVWVGFLIAVGLFAGTQLGFIPNHAP